MNLAMEDFEFVRTVVRDMTGNEIGQNKAYLVETRLLPVAAAFGTPQLSEFLRYVRRTRDRNGLVQIAEAMLITETYFFREPQTLDYLSAIILPSLMSQRGGRTLRLWSAACSCGQEVYSLAMLLAEHNQAAGSSGFQITGSDLCTGVLEQARRAEYSTVEVERNLPERYRRHFIARGSDRWHLLTPSEVNVDFRVCNLKSEALPGPWDVVFIRNVLIYFCEDLRQAVLRRIHQQLAPDGWMILGKSETSRPPENLFRRVASGTACFQKIHNNAKGPLV
jgi:chemotaxis protein methyltransferase CheR